VLVEIYIKFKNAMREKWHEFMSEKWCHKLHSHTQNFNSRCWIFLTEKFFMLQQWKLWGKIYEFIYMPLLLPLPVHMCVRGRKTIFFRWKEWKTFFLLHCVEETPSEALSHLCSSYWYCQYDVVSHSFSREGVRDIFDWTEMSGSPPKSHLTLSLNFELTWEAISWHGEV
jgi:hypothetical protein